jgi:hypothetical protein
MAARDDIGSRGEFIFCARIMDFCGRELPYFRPRFLGEKAQTLDYLVELVGTPGRTVFFFVQVKTTQQGYTRKGRRLRVGVSGADLRRLSQVPAPTYLVGIDEPGEVAYLLAVLEGMSKPISSLPTAFPLDRTNLGRLHQEVEQFWAGRDMARRRSVFSMRGTR